MDKIDELNDKRVIDLLQKIDKLTEGATIQHKHALKYKNKLFDLCKKLSDLKICPINFGIILNKEICKKCRPTDKNEQNILECWRNHINAD